MTKTKFIAEVASNHGGDLKVAKEFIKTASGIGIDYIKFQSWRAQDMKKNDPQYEWFKKSELSDSAHYELMEECKKCGIKFLTTCFDIKRVDFLSGLGFNEIKVSSADTASYAMIEKLKTKFSHLLVSTGMATEDEITRTASILKESKFTFFHCVSLYPTPAEKVNILRLDWLRQFTPSIGYSDHCIGIDAAKLAIARGVSYIEKHFTLGEGKCARTMPWDATPADFEEIIKFREQCVKLFGDGELHLEGQILKAREAFIGRFGDNK